MTQANAIATTIETSEPLPSAPEQIQSGWTSLIPMVLIFVVFYFLLIRPQEKKRKAQEQLVSTVKPGEDIITHSGIYGKVSKVNEDEGTVTVEVAKGIEVKMLKSSVGDIISRKKAATAKESKTSDKPTPEATPKTPTSTNKKVKKPAEKKQVKTTETKKGK